MTTHLIGFACFLDGVDDDDDEDDRALRKNSRWFRRKSKPRLSSLLLSPYVCKCVCVSVNSPGRPANVMRQHSPLNGAANGDRRIDSPNKWRRWLVGRKVARRPVTTSYEWKGKKTYHIYTHTQTDTSKLPFCEAELFSLKRFWGHAFNLLALWILHVSSAIKCFGNTHTWALRYLIVTNNNWRQFTASFLEATVRECQQTYFTYGINITVKSSLHFVTSWVDIGTIRALKTV